MFLEATCAENGDYICENMEGTNDSNPLGLLLEGTISETPEFGPGQERTRIRKSQESELDEGVAKRMKLDSSITQSTTNPTL